jgi:hypothetical protein
MAAGQVRVDGCDSTKMPRRRCYGGSTGQSDWSDVVKPHGDEASSVLKSFYLNTDSEELKYKIDLILAEFNGEKEGIISILRFGNYDASARQLNYHCDVLVWKGTNLTVEIAFQNVTTGKKWNMPANLDVKLTDHEQMGRIKNITLPKDLPNGRYRVFYEFSHDGEVVSTSHFFEADL